MFAKSQRAGLVRTYISVKIKKITKAKYITPVVNPQAKKPFKYGHSATEILEP